MVPAVDTVERFGQQAGLAARRFAAFSLAAGSFVTAIVGIKTGLQEAVEFQQQIVKIGQVGQVSTSTLGSLVEEITRLSTNLGVSSKSLVDVSSTLVQAGLSAKDTKVALEALAKTTLAPSFGDIKNTTEGAIAILSQFKIGAVDLERALSSVNSIAAAFAAESADLTTVIQRTGGAFKTAAGDSDDAVKQLSELLGLFTSVRATTRESADEIATGLRTIFGRLQRPDTITFLKEYGVELNNLQGKFVGPYEAVKRLHEGFKNLDPQSLDFAKVVEQIGGLRQLSRVIPLIQQFPIAVRAVSVAQAGQNSLTIDATRAQESFLVRLSKVKEQYLDLFRVISQNKTVQGMANGFLKLAEALATTAKKIEPLIPLFTILAAQKLTVSSLSFLSGFGKNIADKDRVLKRSSGGPVPGFGTGDSVPAYLEPKEFVIRKHSAQQIGHRNLEYMNRTGQIPQKQAKGDLTKKIYRDDRDDVIIDAKLGDVNRARRKRFYEDETGQLELTPQSQYYSQNRSKRFAARFGKFDSNIQHKKYGDRPTRKINPFQGQRVNFTDLSLDNNIENIRQYNTLTEPAERKVYDTIRFRQKILELKQILKNKLSDTYQSPNPNAPKGANAVYDFLDLEFPKIVGDDVQHRILTNLNLSRGNRNFFSRQIPKNAEVLGVGTSGIAVGEHGSDQVLRIGVDTPYNQRQQFNIPGTNRPLILPQLNIRKIGGLQYEHLPYAQSLQDLGITDEEISLPLIRSFLKTAGRYGARPTDAHEGNIGFYKRRLTAIDPDTIRFAKGGLVKNTTRLYRAETHTGKDGNIPDWLKDQPEFKATQSATGRWFYRSLREAKEFAKIFGDKDTKISYVDVLKENLEKYRSSNNEGKKFASDGITNEFFVPSDIAQIRQPFTKKLAHGGKVHGYSQGDSVPALLTPQEYVIKKDSAQQIGYSNLRYMNEKGKIPGFNKGGVVGMAKGDFFRGYKEVDYNQLNQGLNKSGQQLLDKKLIEATRLRILELQDVGTLRASKIADLALIKAKQNNEKVLVNSSGDIVGFSRVNKAVTNELQNIAKNNKKISDNAGGGFFGASKFSAASLKNPAILLGALGGSFVNTEAGKGVLGDKYQQVASSTITGAISGFSLGTFASGGNALIGVFTGLISAVTAANTALKDYTDTQDKINTSKQLESFVEALKLNTDKIGLNTNTASNIRGGNVALQKVIQAGDKKANETLFGVLPFRFDDLFYTTDEVNQRKRKESREYLQENAQSGLAPAVQQINQLATQVTSLDELKKAGGGAGEELLRFIATLQAGTNTGEEYDAALKKFTSTLDAGFVPIKKLDQALINAAKTAEKFRDVQANIIDFSTALETVSFKLERFQGGFGDILEGQRLKSNPQFGALTQPPGLTGQKEFKEQLDVLLEPLGSQGKDINNFIVEQRRAVAELRSILKVAANVSTANNLSTFVTERLKEKGVQNPTILDNVNESFVKLAGKSEDTAEVMRKLQTDFDQIFGQISKDLLDFSTPLGQAGQQYSRINTALEESIGKLQKYSQTLGEETDKISDISLSQVELGARRKAETLGVSPLTFISRAQEEAPFRQKIQRLAGSEDPATIGKRILEFNKDAEKLRPFIDKIGESANKLKFAELQTQIQNSKRALELLANASDRVAKIEDRLSQLRQQEEGQFDFFKRIAGAGPEELQKLNQEGSQALLGVNLFNTGGRLDQLPQQIRQGVVQALSGTFGNFQFRSATENGKPLSGDQILKGFFRRGLPNLGLPANVIGLNKTEQNEKNSLQEQQSFELSRAAEAQRQIVVLYQEGINKEREIFSKSVDTFKTATEDFARAFERSIVEKTGEKTIEAQASLKAALGRTATPADKSLFDVFAANQNKFKEAQEKQADIKKIPDTAEIRKKLAADIRPIADTGKSPAERGLDPFAANNIQKLTQLPAGQIADLFEESKKAELDKLQSLKSLGGIWRGSEYQAREPDFNKNVKEDFFNRLTQSATAFKQTRTDEISAIQQQTGVSSESLQKIISNFDAMEKAAKSISESGGFEKLTQQIDQLNSKLLELQPIQRASGGPVFKPRGTDRIPAMLSPGEYIVNSASTQANYGLLESINRARGGPVYLGRGGELGGKKRRYKKSNIDAEDAKIDPDLFVEEKLKEQQKFEREQKRRNIRDDRSTRSTLRSRDLIGLSPRERNLANLRSAKEAQRREQLRFSIEGRQLGIPPLGKDIQRSTTTDIVKDSDVKNSRALELQLVKKYTDLKGREEYVQTIKDLSKKYTPQESPTALKYAISSLVTGGTSPAIAKESRPELRAIQQLEQTFGPKKSKRTILPQTDIGTEPVTPIEQVVAKKTRQPKAPKPFTGFTRPRSGQRPNTSSIPDYGAYGGPRLPTISAARSGLYQIDPFNQPQNIDLSAQSYEARVGALSKRRTKLSTTTDILQPRLQPLYQETAIGQPFKPVKRVAGGGLPDYIREEMITRGLDPNRPFNDIDRINPSYRKAVELDPTLTTQQKQNVLETGSPKGLLTNKTKRTRKPSSKIDFTVQPSVTGRPRANLAATSSIVSTFRTGGSGARLIDTINPLPQTPNFQRTAAPFALDTQLVKEIKQFRESSNVTVSASDLSRSSKLINRAADFKQFGRQLSQVPSETPIIPEQFTKPFRRSRLAGNTRRGFNVAGSRQPIPIAKSTIGLQEFLQKGFADKVRGPLPAGSDLGVGSSFGKPSSFADNIERFSRAEGLQTGPKPSRLSRFGKPALGIATGALSAYDLYQSGSRAFDDIRNKRFTGETAGNLGISTVSALNLAEIAGVKGLGKFNGAAGRLGSLAYAGAGAYEAYQAGYGNVQTGSFDDSSFQRGATRAGAGALATVLPGVGLGILAGEAGAYGIENYNPVARAATFGTGISKYESERLRGLSAKSGFRESLQDIKRSRVIPEDGEGTGEFKIDPTLFEGAGRLRSEINANDQIADIERAIISQNKGFRKLLPASVGDNYYEQLANNFAGKKLDFSKISQDEELNTILQKNQLIAERSLDRQRSIKSAQFGSEQKLSYRDRKGNVVNEKTYIGSRSQQLAHNERAAELRADPEYAQAANAYSNALYAKDIGEIDSRIRDANPEIFETRKIKPAHSIYRAQGGSIFKPRGTDTIPAMLSEGEYVVNAASTRANKSLLERINSANGPVYRASGGAIKKYTDEEVRKILAGEVARQTQQGPVNQSPTAIQDTSTYKQDRINKFTTLKPKRTPESISNFISTDRIRPPSQVNTGIVSADRIRPQYTPEEIEQRKSDRAIQSQKPLQSPELLTSPYDGSKFRISQDKRFRTSEEIIGGKKSPLELTKESILRKRVAAFETKKESVERKGEVFKRVRPEDITDEVLSERIKSGDINTDISGADFAREGRLNKPDPRRQKQIDRQQVKADQFEAARANKAAGFAQRRTQAAEDFENRGFEDDGLTPLGRRVKQKEQRITDRQDRLSGDREKLRLNQRPAKKDKYTVPGVARTPDLDAKTAREGFVPRDINPGFQQPGQSPAQIPSTQAGASPGAATSSPVKTQESKAIDVGGFAAPVDKFGTFTKDFDNSVEKLVKIVGDLSNLKVTVESNNIQVTVAEKDLLKELNTQIRNLVKDKIIAQQPEGGNKDGNLV